MTDDQAVCGLPGCDKPVVYDQDGGTPRKYCSSKHRALARQRRRDENTSQQAAEEREDAAAIDVGDTDTPSPLWFPDAEEFEEAMTSRLGLKTTLPREWETTERGGDAPVKPTKRLPFGGPTAVTKRRAAVVLGTVMAIAIGSVVVTEVSSSSQSGGAAPSPVMLPPAPIPEADATQWVDAARVALASVRQQLDELDQADSSLQPSLATDQSGEAVQLRQELNARRADLQKQAASLDAAISSAEHVQPTEQTLEGVRQQLASIAQMTPATGAKPPSGDSATNTVLDGQRAALNQQLDNLQRELQSWRSSLASAVDVPLPDDKEKRDTQSFKQRVDELRASLSSGHGPAQRKDLGDHYGDWNEMALGPKRHVLQGHMLNGITVTSAPPRPDGSSPHAGVLGKLADVLSAVPPAPKVDNNAPKIDSKKPKIDSKKPKIDSKKPKMLYKISKVGRQHKGVVDKQKQVTVNHERAAVKDLQAAVKDVQAGVKQTPVASQNKRAKPANKKTETPPKPAKN